MDSGTPTPVRTPTRGGMTPVLARTAVRAATATWGGDRRQQRLRVCTAADLLLARGLRVRVVNPPVAWPRGPRLVVANASGWADVLALATVVPGTPVVDAALAARPLLRVLARRGGLLVDDGSGAVRGQVTALLRAGATVTASPGEGATPDDPGRFRARVLAPAVDVQAAVCPVAVRPAGRGVLEVHLLSALQPGHDARALAALAEYAVAHVLESGTPIPGHPGTVRPQEGYGRPRP